MFAVSSPWVGCLASVVLLGTFHVACDSGGPVAVAPCQGASCAPTGENGGGEAVGGDDASGGLGGLGGLGGMLAQGGDPGAGGQVAGPVPDFSLLDVNATSPTHGDPVSPRDYLMQVSAWYFAHAT